MWAVVALIAALTLGRAVMPSIAASLEATRGGGVGGVLGFSVAYVLATALLWPATPLSLAAGALWGPVGGACVVWPAATVGAQIAFLWTRAWGRDRVVAALGDRPVWSAVDRAVGQGGARAVMLLRASPLFPFNLLHVAFGLGGTQPRDHLLGTAVGIVPGVVLVVSAGATLGRLGEPHDASWPEIALWGVGLVATAWGVGQIGRAAARELAASEADDGGR
jgi:uncharacterized membrane protein YdjX (TVP38/TMEM64 family)